MSRPIYQRLLENLDIAPNGCWLWMGFRTPDGYGRMTIMHGPGRKWKSEIVSRVAFQHFKGPIEPNKLICHTCDTPACFRPSHLYQGTHDTNAQDKVRRGRSNPPFGERAGSAKLTNETVVSIRRDYSTGKFSMSELGAIHGVDKTTISGIVLRKTWRHV